MTAFSAPAHRHRLRNAALTWAVLALCSACTDSSATSEASSGGSTSAQPPSTSESSGTTSSSSSSSATSESTASTTGSSSGSSDTTSGPFEDPTAFDTDVAIECNTLDQDCAEGERCTPYANDGGDEWNAVRCVPIDSFESTLGETCEIEGDIRSGFDNCGPGTMCLDVDPDPGLVLLECVAMCVGTPDNFDTPTCADPDLSCVIEGTRAVCLPPEATG